MKTGRLTRWEAGALPQPGRRSPSLCGAGTQAPQRSGDPKPPRSWPEPPAWTPTYGEAPLTHCLAHSCPQPTVRTYCAPASALGPGTTVGAKPRAFRPRGSSLLGAMASCRCPEAGIPPTCNVGTQDGEGGVHAAAQNRKEEEVTPEQRQVQKEAAHPWCHHSLLQPWVPVLTKQLPSPQAPSSRQPLGLPGRSLHRAAWTLCHSYGPQISSPASRMKSVTSCSPFSSAWPRLTPDPGVGACLGVRQWLPRARPSDPHPRPGPPVPLPH